MEMLEHEKQWLTDEGAEMMGSLGVEGRSSVIDFGCGRGRYTIPLSQVVGENGHVLAVERDAGELAVLRERMTAFAGQGPIRILNSEDVCLESVDDAAIDSVLAFDVLQYVEDWDVLFASIRRVLKPGGTVHVYPAHVPHPGGIDVERAASILRTLGLQGGDGRRFRMMHNKDMVVDDVFTFILPSESVD
jgi:ubiquinone/menaquinone biosynthesis C-methylase UbiE